MIRYFADGSRNFQTYPDPPARRSHWEFFVLFKGSIAPQFALPGWESPKGSNFWLIPPRTPYHWEADLNPCLRLAIHFAHVPQLVEDHARKQRFLARRLDEEQLRRVRAITEPLLAHYEKPSQFSPLVFERSLIDLSLLAMEGMPPHFQDPLEMRNAQRVESALAWYGKNLEARPTLRQVADAISVSTPHLRRLFNDVMRSCPQAALTRVRLERACLLLDHTSATLDEIALRSGFGSAIDLCRVFKKHHLTTPNLWRRHRARGPNVEVEA